MDFTFQSPRGVHECHYLLHGQPGYYALTAAGALVRGVRIVMPHESRAEVVAYLADLLDTFDPLRLTLVSDAA